MKADELRQMYLDFFKSKGHAVISGSSLIPQNDPTVLFTTAGMHPLVPYLLGEKHPAGTRLCDCQKCIRTGDIDSVGDRSHLTFFEMLGNWSLGDYFKEEAIAWSHEFLTSKAYLGFDPAALSVTVFEGNAHIPKDDTSIAIWRKLGIPESRIFALPMKDNWWGPAGKTGPCGPDTEMFVDTGKDACGADCRPGCSCGKYFEIWNDVFMQYNKQDDGAYVPLAQHNVDTGMGVERTIAMLQGKRSVYETELFASVIEVISAASGKTMTDDPETTKAFRVVADHIRSSVFILGDEQGISPSNLGQGYVLRRLIRRSVRYAKQLGLQPGFSRALAGAVIDGYQHVYPELGARRETITTELSQEEEKFEKTLSRGMAELDKVIGKMLEFGQAQLPGKVAFRLYDTCGFPLEFTEEICSEKGLLIDRAGFEDAFDKHKEVSKASAEKAFKGGLADNSEMTTRLHTATHLLHKALQTVLGEHARQKGSNITSERLRFDFTHTDKMTPEQITQVETMVNDAIRADYPVTVETMTIEEARERGATALFTGKYGEQVKVYTVGDFSMEVCGGPHVLRTGELGHFKIQKEESSSAGVRRIRAVLE
ncbi:MAG TPA: alanine--tRNA ligase [Verrucomicrobia bacterium]|nr:alanine--tRNA ligase [Verrucomicrobiota bacterium]